MFAEKSAFGLVEFWQQTHMLMMDGENDKPISESDSLRITWLKIFENNAASGRYTFVSVFHYITAVIVNTCTISSFWQTC